MKIISAIKSLRERFLFSLLKETTKNRSQLRQQLVDFEGKPIKAIEYIRIIDRRLPVMWKLGVRVDHHKKLTELYHRFDLQGIHWYISWVGRVTKRSSNRILKLQKR